jgi:hypothetical protein
MLTRSLGIAGSVEMARRRLRSHRRTVSRSRWSYRPSIEGLEGRATPSVTLTTLATFPAAGQKLGNGNTVELGDGLAADGQGDVFYTTVTSKTNGAPVGGALVELVKGRHQTRTVATFGDGSDVPSDLVIDASGNIFGLTDGAYGDGAVVELPAGSHTTRTLLTLDSESPPHQNTLPGFEPGDLVLAGGMLYFDATASDDASGILFSVPASGGAPKTVGTFSGGVFAQSLTFSNGYLYGIAVEYSQIDIASGFKVAAGGGAIITLGGGLRYVPSPGATVVSGGAMYGIFRAQPTVAGSVFQLPVQTVTSQYITLPFSGEDGDLLNDLALDGNLVIGVAEAGGKALHYGTLFEVIPSIGIKNLASFTDSATGGGGGPSSLIANSAGDLFGYSHIGTSKIAIFEASGVVKSNPAPPPPRPGTLTWTGKGDGVDWSDPANWDKKRAPIDGDSLVFPAGHAASMENTLSDLALVSITIAGNYTLAGNQIGVAVGIHVTSGKSTLAIPTVLAFGGTVLKVSGGTLDVTRALGGAGQIDLSGPVARLELAGTNTLKGPTTVQAIQTTGGEIYIGNDTLQVDNPQALGSGDLTLDGGTLSYTGTQPLILPQATDLEANVTLVTGAASSAIQFRGVDATVGSTGLTLSGPGSVAFSLAPDIGLQTLILTGAGTTVSLAGRTFVLHAQSDSGSGSTASVNTSATSYDVHAVELANEASATQVFITGLDNALLRSSYQGAQWSPWQSLLAALKAFDVVRDWTGNVELYGIGALTGHLYEYNDGAILSVGPSSLVNSLLNHWATVDATNQYLEVSAVVSSDHIVDVYAVSNQGTVYVLPTRAKGSNGEIAAVGFGYNGIEVETGLTPHNLVLFAHSDNSTSPTSGWDENRQAIAGSTKLTGWKVAPRWVDGGVAIPLAQMPPQKKTASFEIRLVGEVDVSKWLPPPFGISGWEFEIKPSNPAAGTPSMFTFAGAGFSIGGAAGFSGGSTNWESFETKSPQTVSGFVGFGGIGVGPSVSIGSLSWSTPIKIGFIHLAGDVSSVSFDASFTTSVAAGWNKASDYIGLWLVGGSAVV